MKQYLMIAIAALAFVNANLAKADSEFDQARAHKAELMIQEQKLKETIGYSSLRVEAIREEMKFIETYAGGNLNLSKIIGEFPLTSEAAYMGALGLAARYLNRSVNAIALSEAELGLVKRMIQRYPALTKYAGGVAGIVATGYSIYYVVNKVSDYNRFESMTSDELDAYYVSLLKELEMRRRMVIEATRELQPIRYELDQISASEMQKDYKLIR